MATKTISIKEDVYERLLSLKAPGESFSDELRRLSSSGSIMDLAGSWNKLSDKDANKIKDRILEKRSDRSRLIESHQKRK